MRKLLISVIMLFILGCSAPETRCTVNYDPLLWDEFILVPAGSTICNKKIKHDGLYLTEELFKAFFGECNKEIMVKGDNNGLYR